MPTPNQQAQMHAIPARLLDMMKPSESNLATEVAALREEIAALRSELRPVSSLILTGQQVAMEFQRLHKAPE